MSIRAVIFDLDGTLLDTLEDIAAAANHALASMDLPTHAVERYKRMVGEGADVLMRRAIEGADDATIARAVAAFKDYYIAHPVDHTTLYPGMGELLDELSFRGLPMAVLTNKPHRNAMLVVERLLSRWPWAAIQGEGAGVAKKPDPSGALAIAHQLGIDPPQIAFVGDTKIDMQTAVNAGMIPVGAEWGFRDRAELLEHGAMHLIRDPRALLAALAGRGEPTVKRG